MEERLETELKSVPATARTTSAPKILTPSRLRSPKSAAAGTVEWTLTSYIADVCGYTVGYLLGSGKPYYALALLGLILPQVFFQFKYFLKDPVKNDVKYQASAQPFLVLGLLVTALATSH
ncbi:hypothetical protein RHMOL_Rhmol04G0189400 [Rhododendron molle]|uniref:Uncharacterized protein n=1 Tax=Rhododendron molle TaxID=49168 RepID=A0ACC0P270_RHOML|nr:hypothetical protein RHMOL_Rhmol04G0189400 [Rhododendron molle]